MISPIILYILPYNHPHSKGTDMFRHQYMRLYLYAILCIIPIKLIFGQTAADSVYYGRKHYVAYFPGNIPLIISAPHGGGLTPSEIPDRTYGTTVTDDFTIETTMALRRAIFDYIGVFPHVIVSYLKRTKLDPNRDLDEAAQGNVYAEQAWREYHDFIDQAEDSVTARFGKGFYVDIHGHGHAIHRLELGYLLSASDLAQSDNTLNAAIYVEKSSIRALAQSIPVDFSGLLRGYNSLGSLIARQGIRAIPSSDEPSPGSGNPYFSGGYSTARHGSRTTGRISGVQIEAYRTGLRDTGENRLKYARALTRALDQYFRNFYGWNGLQGRDTTISPPPDAYLLEQNEPNPCRSSTTIYFDMPRDDTVILTIYNMLGQKIMQKTDRFQDAGRHGIQVTCNFWPSGLYFYRLKTGNFVKTRKMVVVH